MTENAPRRRPTIEDVARESGVSRGTVSRVLNGGHWVSPTAREAVERAIKKTGYRINPHARNLATARANSIAFLLTESHDRLFEDPNFAVLMRGAADALAERDLPLVLLMAGSDDEQRRATEFITAGHVDGALLVSSHLGREGFLKSLVDAEVPVVACGVPLGYERRIGYVAADDLEGARDMVAYLRDSGRRRIATISGPVDTSGGIGRLEGYRLELGDAFDGQLVAEGDYSRASGAQAMTELLERVPDLDAVFVANDVMAAGAVEVLQSRGRRVPDDVAVAGFDDAPIATRVEPALTTMRQPFERIAHEMVRMLLDVIDGRPAGRMTLPTELVRRESA
ncbi:DNA-binding LacI/PurR family transcriptional regulator [Agromyces hippuratus]|uniref:DNA-binding LacI/PurR family transcriptional regulator n=1 Tax=Agromyces hippuratus TaxID=286438 RepID=A0A852WT61_9MICO|nr:LacI family DNA-binding transcriptional regulator [Agromyces hippuratus]NYG21146.1 DNA-binding LacI/PurR family transcriptional regulator [Agromyces hippuratus]